jgi:exosortase E/protease (VPEID-CTERM system)
LQTSNPSLASAVRQHRAVGLRLILLALLFLLQYEAVEVALRGYYEPATIRTSVWEPVAAYKGYALISGVLLVGALALLLWPRLPAHWSQFRQVAAEYPWRRPLFFQLMAYGVAVLATWALSTRPETLGSLVPLVLVGWVTSIVATACLALLTLAPGRYWLELARTEKTALATGVVAAAAAGAAGFRAQVLLPALGLRDWTMRSAEELLRLAYGDVVSIPTTRTLGTSAFQVEITDACAGYEGIALVTVFFALYVSLFRRDFRFPHVLLALPVGILVIWAFNVLRIATLIVIGTAWSPEVAIAGFHSNAGWIAFILVSFGLLALLHRVPFFAAAGRAGAPRRAVRETDALLVPMVVLLAATLLTSAFSAGFDWLYPLRVLATAAALWVFRASYRLAAFRVTAAPVAIGAGVFLLWLLLVPAPAEQSAELGAHLQGVPPWVAGAWVLFRFLGAAITVPLAEELAFRGYLLARLGGRAPTVQGALRFAWFPFLASSVLFGAFHGDWVAGILAGMAYAVARYRRGEIGDAVLAHMTTNALLSMFVLGTQRWAYW